MISNSKNKNILVVRLGKIGDIIISSFVFDIIKKNNPQTKIYLLTLDRNREVLKYNPNIDQIYLVNKNILLWFKLLLIRRIKFDMLIDLNDDPSSTSKLIRKIIHAKVLAGYKFYKNDKLDFSVERPSKESSHIIERVKLLIQKLNFKFNESEVKPKLYLGEKENQEVLEELKPIKRTHKILAVNISAGAEIRYWTSEKWIELLNKINTVKDNLYFLILSDKDDVSLSEKIVDQISNKNVMRNTLQSFQHFASYINNSDMLISADTSAVHIASALNKPVTALFPDYEWNFVSWQPLSDKFVSIRSQKHSIDAISVDEVFTSFLQLYKEVNL